MNGKRLLGFACLVASALPVLAVTGTIVGEDGGPVGGVRVCYYHSGAEQLCVETNTHGLYSLPDSTLDTLRASKTGYHPATFSARGQQAPFTLRLSPTLWVRFIDAVGKRPIAKGDLYVVYPSGVQKGPFPVNKAGVRIERVLEAGDVVLRAEVEGFELHEPRTVTLEAGKETKVDLELGRKEPDPK